MSTNRWRKDFEGFQNLELTPKPAEHRGAVYVLVFVKDDVQIPFYVGQTSRFLARMDDYFWGIFQAPTDFKIATAIQYFCSDLGGRVIAKHKPVVEPRVEERTMIERLKASGALLLNGRAYNYKTDSVDEVIASVRSLCREIVTQAEQMNANN